MMMMIHFYTEPSPEDVYRRKLHSAERKAKALSGRITMFLADLEKSGLKKADLEKIRGMIPVTTKTEKNG